MFAGLMSRCTSPASWAKLSAAATSLAISAACLAVTRPLERRMSAERAAVDVLHGDEVGAGVPAPVVDADDVRVAEVGGRLRLAPEALDEVGVDGELGEQHLDRDLAVEQAVAPEEHVGHAAAPDALAQLVAIVDDRRSVVGRHCCLLAVVYVRPDAQRPTRLPSRSRRHGARGDISPAPPRARRRGRSWRPGRRGGRRCWPRSPRWCPRIVTATA